MTATNDIAKNVIALIAKQLNISADTVLQTDTMERLGADSLDRVEIVMRLEEEFSIEIDDKQAEEMTSVGDVVDYIKKCVVEDGPR